MIARRALLAPLVAAVVLTGCTTSAPPTAPPVPAPSTEAPSTEASSTGVPSTGSTTPAVALPWPDDDVDALQERVDDGTQPWLLDPSEVASAYAAAAYGWDTAQVVAAADGSTVDVTGPDGARRTLALTRQGPGSVWLVTADTPTP